MQYQIAGPAPMPVAPPKPRGRALIVFGALAIVVGVLGALALALSGQQRYDTRVKRLASDSGALSGCITDLNFSKTGVFVLYYVYDGRVRVNGANQGCADDASVNIQAPSRIPTIDVSLTDSSGSERQLSRTRASSADTLSGGGVKAHPFRQVTITKAGDYQITVTAAEGSERFAIGLGPRIEKPALIGPVLVAVLGVALGVLLFIIAGVVRSQARRQPTGTAVGHGYPGPVFQAPGQYPTQPPVSYHPPSSQGFDHPTQGMPPIQTGPQPVGPFAPPPAPTRPPQPAQPSQPAQPAQPASGDWWSPQGQPLPPPRPYDEERDS
jgi:hypothetical protein